MAVGVVGVVAVGVVGVVAVGVVGVVAVGVVGVVAVGVVGVVAVGVVGVVAVGVVGVVAVGVVGVVAVGVVGVVAVGVVTVGVVTKALGVLGAVKRSPLPRIGSTLSGPSTLSKYEFKLAVDGLFKLPDRASSSVIFLPAMSEATTTFPDVRLAGKKSPVTSVPIPMLSPYNIDEPTVKFCPSGVFAITVSGLTVDKSMLLAPA